MPIPLHLSTHAIPLWFLVLSLFFPRICIAIAWIEHDMTRYIPSAVGIIPIIVALLIPRLLILFWIYSDQGIGIWFLIHAVALVFAWGGGSSRVYTRRRGTDVE
ncbi:MAG: hypothetical protein ACP5E5_05930 [Acidobacteriaceae bacterium]